MSYRIDYYWDKIREGDEAAFDMLFRELYPALYYFSSQITGDTFVAEEVVLDVFYNIWEKRKSLVISSSLKSYLFQSVKNHSIDIIRNKRNKKSSFSILVSEQSWQFISETFELDDFIIERITTHETEKDIGQAIEKLSPQCRRIFIMSRFEDRSVDEISEELNISVNTVRSHIYSALLKISEYLHLTK